jgi:hypothetical protein
MLWKDLLSQTDQKCKKITENNKRIEDAEMHFIKSVSEVTLRDPKIHKLISDHYYR